MKKSPQSVVIDMITYYMQREMESSYYSLPYVRSQAAGAIRKWLAGKTPDGTCSDMLCDFWCHLPTLPTRRERVLSYRAQ